MAGPDSTAAPTRRLVRSPALWSAVVVLAVVAPFVADNTAQPASRMALTAALAEHATIAVDDYEEVIYVDRLEHDGHVYSDKAPAQPFLAVPFYAAARAVGADSYAVPRAEGNLTIWWITLWFSAMPAAGLVALMCLACQSDGVHDGWKAALCLLFGTILLTFASQLYSHVLVALCAYAAWLLLSRRPGSTRHALAAGMLAGLAVATEYPSALLVVLLVGHLAWSRRWRDLGALAAGGLPFALALLAYQAALFGNPLTTTYQTKFDGESHSVLNTPDPAGLFGTLLGSRGLLTLTPIMLVAVISAAWFLLRSDADEATEADSAHPPRHLRSDAAMGLAVLGGYALVMSGWPNPWGGEMPGPRYLIIAIPFFALPLAAIWQRASRICVAATAVGAITAGLSTITLHLVPLGNQVLQTYRFNLDEYGVNPTLFTLGLGPAGWIVHLGVAVAAAGGLLRATRSSERSGEEDKITDGPAPVAY